MPSLQNWYFLQVINNKRNIPKVIWSSMLLTLSKMQVLYEIVTAKPPREDAHRIARSLVRVVLDPIGFHVFLIWYVFLFFIFKKILGVV